MATLTVQSITRTAPGITPTYAAAAAGGDSFLSGATTFLHVKNGGGGSITVTVAVVGSPLSGTTLAALSVAVPAGGNKVMGPFPAQPFADPSDGLVDVTYSGVSSVTIGVFDLTQL